MPSTRIDRGVRPRTRRSCCPAPAGRTARTPTVSPRRSARRARRAARVVRSPSKGRKVGSSPFGWCRRASRGGRTRARRRRATAPAPARRPRRRGGSSSSPPSVELGDDGGGQSPPVADRPHRVELRRVHDREHPLLRLAREDLEGLHRRARAAAPRRGRRRRPSRRAPRDLADARSVMPGAAEVLQALEQAGRDQLERGLDQQLLGERVADLHDRPGVLGALFERRAREHAHAADPVAPGRRAVQHHERPDVRRERRGGHEVLGAGDAHAHHVHARVRRVRRRRTGSRRPRWGPRCSCRSRRSPRRRPRTASGSVGSVSGPNISGSSSATGRAPIEMMSRTMPPTPVAAPWYGSIALGCECDSILNTAAIAVAHVDRAGVLARDRRARPAPRSAACAGGSSSTCRSSARTTSRCTSRAPCGWGRDRAWRRSGRVRRRGARAGGGAASRHADRARQGGLRAARRTRPGRRSGRRRDRRHARDAASGPRRCRPRCARRRCCSWRRSGCAPRPRSPSGELYRNATRPSPSTRASWSAVATHCPSPCLIGISTVSPGVRPAVTAVCAVSTRSETSRQTNRSDRFRIRAPGQQTRLAEDLEAVADAEHGPAAFGERRHLVHDRRAGRRSRRPAGSPRS